MHNPAYLEETLADMSKFRPLDSAGKAILFSTLQDKNIETTTDKISFIEALTQIANHNKASIDMLKIFTQKENFYIEINDQEIQKELRKNINSIEFENNMYVNMAKKALKNKNNTIEGQDIVTKSSLKEAIQEVIKIQQQINAYMITAKQYIK
jgi:ABC-type antimicrobial peptide transport system permease subunit